MKNEILGKNKITIVTHNASFHADDVFAVATLLIILPKDKEIEIIRSREREVINGADFVVDVGGEYDAERNRYDHHQKGGAGKRNNEIPYASFGLVWRHLGSDACAGDTELWQRIDNGLVSAIDANDNGFDLTKNLIEGVFAPSLSLNFMIEKPTWEERSNELQMYEAFMRAVTKAKDFLERYIVVERASLVAKREIIAEYESKEDKTIIIFKRDYERINFIYTLVKLPEILFFVYPNNGGTWTAETVPVSENTFEKRKSFPESWAGLSDDDLVKVTGVSDATFCHNGRFVAYARSEAGAIELAKLALSS